MTIALTILCAALVALLAYRERLSHLERQEAAVARARSQAELAAERDRAAAERKELYQRIQAPEIAVHDAQLERRRERPYVPRKPIGADDDAAFAARNEGATGG